ncbi:MAG: zinc-dependent metalloprotease family protein [Gammaproteobacteria bacterium]|nr:zinc-dependent metalloprotease family protein [Gammaproteobacteria bacterium]
MFIDLHKGLKTKKHIYHIFVIFTFICIGFVQNVSAQPMTNVEVNAETGQISWLAGGVHWYVIVEKDGYFGTSIPIINIAVETGNEVLQQEATNCYYRGTMASSTWQPIANSHAFINMCHSNPQVFTGFISGNSQLRVIEEDPSAVGQLVMLDDNPFLEQNSPNDTKAGNNGGSGFGAIPKPDSQVLRKSTADKFPSVEIVVEPSFVETFGTPGYIHRIASTLAFANFVYQQSGINQIHLISINLLDEALNKNGSTGGISHQLQKLRRSTIQLGSGDVSILMVGGDINTANTWGWAVDKNVCELQIAVAENAELDSREVGRSVAFVIDLPSMLQRGWVFAHEFGHVIGAFNHVMGDPLMDGYFQSTPTLSSYVAGCDAKEEMYASCEYDAKTKKLTQFYTCN